MPKLRGSQPSIFEAVYRAATGEAVDCLPRRHFQRDQAAVKIATNDAQIAGATPRATFLRARGGIPGGNVSQS